MKKLIIIFTTSISICFSQDICFILPKCANLRVESNNKSEIISCIKRGQMVLGKYTSGSWKRVEYGNKSGYIFKTSLFSIDDFSEESTEIVKHLKFGNYEGLNYVIDIPKYEEDVPLYIIVYPELLPRDDEIINNHIKHQISNIWNKTSFIREFSPHQEEYATVLDYYEGKNHFKVLLVKDNITRKTGALIIWCIDSSNNLISGVFNSESIDKPRSEPTSESTTINLDVSVRFDGSQFIISNDDGFDWKNVRLEINSSGFKSGYIYKADLLAAGTTYTIGALQFAKKDGERFNPFRIKPINFSIICNLSGGKSGIYYCSWE